MIKLSTSRNMMKNSNSREWHKYRQHESEGTQVFTDPKLLEMMKHDIQRIMCKRVSWFLCNLIIHIISLYFLFQHKQECKRVKIVKNMVKSISIP